MARVSRDYILAVLSHGVFTDREVHGPNRQSAQQEQRAEERENRIGPNDVLHRTSRAHPSSGGLFFGSFQSGSRSRFASAVFPSCSLASATCGAALALHICSCWHFGIATRLRPAATPTRHEKPIRSRAAIRSYTRTHTRLQLPFMMSMTCQPLV
jgi:hypothetical protein